MAASNGGLPRRQLLVLLTAVLFVSANVLYLQQSVLNGQTPLDMDDPKTQFAHALWRATQQESTAMYLHPYVKRESLQRGIVIPVYDQIAPLSMSLILELRAMDVNLPIEIPHCGDLQPHYQHLISLHDHHVRIYDVCKLAANATTPEGEDLFCTSLWHCHEVFRGFNIKVLGVVFSRFQEVMLMDADTIYFQSPMKLWETTKYKTTGTLFFHDRVCCTGVHLAAFKPFTSPEITRFEHLLGTFDVQRYRWLGSIPRKPATSGLAATLRANRAWELELPFEPSDFLLTSHSWNQRSGHQMDSSLVLWNKQRQPRATTILASFVSLNGATRPRAYGDKELFFIACELAETEYAFSDFGVGNLGWEERPYYDPNEDYKYKTAFCGDMVHYFPELSAIDPAVVTVTSVMQSEPEALLYLNSDNILNWSDQRLFRTQPRLAEYVTDSYEGLELPQTCAVNVTKLELTPWEANRFMHRYRHHEMVVGWLDEILPPPAPASSSPKDSSQ